MNVGSVFSIEEFSTFNGPGIRTTVFLKGCPLSCNWCHNPEGKSFENSIIKSPNGCIGCGNCIKYSKNGTYTDDSISHCPNNLLRYCAKEFTPGELYNVVAKNFHILNNGGGITFSGGEPLAQPEFLLSCLKLMKGKTSRAIQTSGYCKKEIFREILTQTDYVLYDIKLINGALHEKYTGKSNKPILENFDVLYKSQKDFVVRTPLIPTVTDTPENISAICELLRSRNINYIELLPYNKMTGSKYPLAGRQYVPDFDESAECNPRLEIFDEYGINAAIK